VICSLFFIATCWLIRGFRRSRPIALTPLPATSGPPPSSSQLVVTSGGWSPPSALLLPAAAAVAAAAAAAAASAAWCALMWRTLAGVEISATGWPAVVR
jgi:hypothetical protein